MSRLDEIKARAEEVHWASTSIERAMARMASSAADVPWLVSEVERLTRVIDAKPRQPLVVLNEYLDRAERAEAEVARLTAERDALAAQVARVEKLAEEWRYKGEFGWGAWQLGEGPDPEGYVMDHCASALRDALAGSDADTGEQETGHKCEPYYSRSECGQCGWQEQWCATCSRQMCGCATGATDQDAMGADQ